MTNTNALVENKFQSLDPIPKWLERLSSFLVLIALALSFVPGSGIKDSIIFLIVAVTLNSVVTAKLRRKVEAMTEIIRNYEKKN